MTLDGNPLSPQDLAGAPTLTTYKHCKCGAFVPVTPLLLHAYQHWFTSPLPNCPSCKPSGWADYAEVHGYYITTGQPISGVEKPKWHFILCPECVQARLISCNCTIGADHTKEGSKPCKACVLKAEPGECYCNRCGKGG